MLCASTTWKTSQCLPSSVYKGRNKNSLSSLLHHHTSLNVIVGMHVLICFAALVTLLDAAASGTACLAGKA